MFVCQLRRLVCLILLPAKYTHICHVLIASTSTAQLPSAYRRTCLYGRLKVILRRFYHSLGSSSYRSPFMWVVVVLFKQITGNLIKHNYNGSGRHFTEQHKHHLINNIFLGMNPGLVRKGLP